MGCASNIKKFSSSFQNIFIIQFLSNQINNKIVDIPYVTKNVSMMIFLPNKIERLLDMEKQIMKKSNLLNFTSKLLKETPVAITLPKFTLESTIVLPNKLKMVEFLLFPINFIFYININI